MISLRKITSLIMLISFIILVYSGITLFMAPQGKIAYWSLWEFLGLTKDEYTNIHINFSLLFLISGLLHIYYNWKPIINYLKNKSKKFVVFTVNFNLALLISIIFFLGTYYKISPFKTILNFSENMKDYWEEVLGSPPMPHAEQLSLKNLCNKFSIDLEKAKKALINQNIKIGSVNETLSQIAKNNGISPNHIWEIIKEYKKSGKNSNTSTNEPTGLGKLTLIELCNKYNIDYNKASNILKEYGFKFKQDTKIKEISSQKGMLPIDIYNLLQKKE